MTTPVPYIAPSWTPPSLTPPAHKLNIAALPTPIHSWHLKNAPDTTELFIKRDDATGPPELAGNKLRKLEFLLADALQAGCDSVITVGGIQSNHCRATAAAARRVGLVPHIILRTSEPTDADPGLVGNLMVDRLVGAEIHLVSDAEFARKGGWKLCCELRDDLEDAGSKPYAFPSGGSNSLGSWGYTHAVDEICEQVRSGGLAPLDRIYFACGSGGTAAGLALGVHYSGLGESGTELVGLCVDDTPDFFYDKINGLMRGCHSDFTDLQSRELCTLLDCVGDGYAISTDEELRFLIEAARSTGVVLDPVYSGKAARGMMMDLRARPVARALFVHTGGLLGNFAKESQLDRVMMSMGER